MASKRPFMNKNFRAVNQVFDHLDKLIYMAKNLSKTSNVPLCNVNSNQYGLIMPIYYQIHPNFHHHEHHWTIGIKT